MTSPTPLTIPSDVPEGHVPIWSVRVRYRVDIGTKTKAAWVSSYLDTVAAFMPHELESVRSRPDLAAKCGRKHSRPAEKVRCEAVEVLAYLSYTAWKHTTTKTT